MCERNQGEPLAAYLLRLAITKPTSIFWLLGFAAAAWIYTDMKELITTNTTLMRETAASVRPARLAEGFGHDRYGGGKAGEQDLHPQPLTPTASSSK